MPLTGFCPACTGPLEAGADGTIICRKPGCPRPTAAAEILSETETGHIVVLGRSDFSMKHPLVERIADVLLDCPLLRYCSASGPPPEDAGKFRVTGGPDGWEWEKLP